MSLGGALVVPAADTTATDTDTDTDTATSKNNNNSNNNNNYYYLSIAGIVLYSRDYREMFSWTPRDSSYVIGR